MNHQQKWRKFIEKAGLQVAGLQEAVWMERRATLILGGAALLAGAAGAGVLAAAGAASASAAFGGLMAACSAACLAQVQMLQSDRKAFRQAFTELQADMVDVVERQARVDAKFNEIERRTIESPALVWRAAAADIEVLGSLVSDLARSVADHEKRLESAMRPEVVEPVFLRPEFLEPQFSEPEAELGFTADEPVQPLAAPSPIVIAELRTTLAAALTSERLELCLQPIVELPQRKAKGYEASLRLRGDNEQHQGDAELRRIAAATGLEHELDRVLIERAVQVLRVLRARNRAVSMVCAVAGKSLADPTFISMTETLIRNDSALAKTLVFDLSDMDFRGLGKAEREQLRVWCGKGLAVGLSGLTDLKLDLAAMAAVGLRQIRIPAGVILAAAANGEGMGDIHPADLAEYLHRRGIDLLVSDMTSEQVVIDLLEFGTPYAIGPLFGPSRPVRPEVLEPKAVEPAQAQQKPMRTNEPTITAQEARRQSYRSMLRRA